MFDINIFIVIVYFIFLGVLGWAFRHATSSTSEYFRGGGRMLWWMVGATAFLQALSAMTFTGLMGKAFLGGLSIPVIFFANATGYFCNFLFYAAKARQMRVISPVQGIRLRFGKLNEQVFTWFNIPVNVLQAALWLNGLAVFTSSAVHFSTNVTIVATGIIVLLMSLIGGSWAVIASDVLQMIIIMIITTVTGIVAIVQAGGLGNLLSKGLPAHTILGTGESGYNYAYLFVGWFVCIFVKQFFSTNNMVDAYRYIAAKDSKHARKAAILACALSVFGPLVWFLPAWYMAGFDNDIHSWGLDVLKDKITDATYFVFVRDFMPVGMVGLMLSAMFAATMSSMDSALNRNAGIVLKSVYEPYFCRKPGDEKHLMNVSQILTVVFGLLIIGAALFLNTLRNYGLFDLVMFVGTLVAIPILIPSIMCFFVRKTPDWAGWGTIVVGCCVSAAIAQWITPDIPAHLAIPATATHPAVPATPAIKGSVNILLQHVAPIINGIFGTHYPSTAETIHITAREFGEFKSVVCGIVGHMGITLPFFLLTQLFYKEPVGERKADIEKFFTNVSTPVVVEDTQEGVDMDNKQNSILGRMVVIAGAFILLLIFVPQPTNPVWGRLTFVLIAVLMAIVGTLLIKGKRKDIEPKKE